MNDKIIRSANSLKHVCFSHQNFEDENLKCIFFFTSYKGTLLFPSNTDIHVVSILSERPKKRASCSIITEKIKPG